MNKYLILLLSFIGLNMTQCSRHETVDNKALEVVKRFNEKCPMMIDSETRIDGIEVKNSNSIIYKYTLVNVNAENVDTIMFNSALRPGIVNALKTDPSLKELRDIKANFEYHYKDKKNQFIYSFTVTAKDYQI